MKTNFKRIGKQSISIVLAVMMMLSTMLVGTVTSNAVSDAHFYVVGAPVNSNDWNQKSAIIDGNYGSDSVYYIDIALTKGCYFALHNGSNRYSPNTDGEDIGLNTIKTSNDYNANNAWHYTGDTGTKRIVVDQSVKEWYPTVRIENIPSATTHKVTANFRKATVKLGDKILTSGTAETVDNDKSYTLTVEPNRGYSLSKVMQGSNDLGKSGTYTLAAGTDDVTIDITTENNTFDPSNTVYLRMDSNWPSPYGVHIWKNGGEDLTNWIDYPKMTYITTDEDGNDIYGYTPENGNNLSDYDSIIFRAGDKGDKKTGEIKGVPLAGKIYSAKNKTWSDYSQKYSVNIAQYDADKGNVSISPSQSLAQGETFTVNAVPKTGYSVDIITVTDEHGTEVTKNSDNSYKMPASNVTVKVTFKANEHTLTLKAPESGTTGYVDCTITPAAGSVAYGTEVKVVVNVESGYAASLNLGDVNVTTTIEGNKYTFTFAMPNDNIVVAPTIGARGVDTPIVTLNGSTTGSTLKTNVNKIEKIIANVVIPTDSQSYTAIDESKCGFAQLTYNGNVVAWNDYVVDNGNKLTSDTQFKFGAPGTYQLTYNGVVCSTIDNTKTNSANATLTIEVTYSEVQQAYLDLKTLVEDTVNYPESVTDAQYKSGVAEYNAARKAAADAIKGTSLPDYDDEDTYTALNKALVTAKNNLVEARTFYIGGQFKTSVIDNTAKWVDHPTEIDEDGNPKAGQEIKFEAVTSTLYKVETNLDITANNGNYFFVYSKSGTFYRDYGAPSNTVFNGKTSLSNSQTLTNTGYDEHQLYFNNVASAPNAVMWLDTSGLASDGSGSMKIFYTSGTPTAKYSLTGGDSKGAKVDWASGWNTYDAQYTVNEQTDNPFVFSKTIVVNDENGAYFRINTSSDQYGPSKDQTEITSVKSTTITTSNNAFKIPSGTYRLFVDQSGATPVIWIEASDYTVSAVGQYTFNGSSYNNFTSNPPTITVASKTVKAGQAVTVTATDDVQGYKFTGWVSSNGTFANSSALSTSFTPRGNNAVAVARYAKVLSVSVAKSAISNDGTWTVGTANSNVSTYLAGTDLSITFTPADSKDIVSNVTVEGKDYSTSVYNNVVTFMAGVENEDDNTVQVIVTFSTRPKYRYDFDLANGCTSDMGTVNSSDANGQTLAAGSYEYGTKITAKAEPKDGYSFVGWYSDINATGEMVSSSKSYTFELKKDTELFAKFTENTGTMIPNLYLIYSDSDSNPSKFTQYLNLYCDADGQVYAYFDSEHFDSSKTYCFTISNSVGQSTSWEYAYDNYNNSEAFANESNRMYLDCGRSGYNLPKQGQGQYESTTFAKFRVLDDYADTISSVKIKLGYYDDKDIVKSLTDSTKATTYEIIPDATGTVSSRVKVYAKDGTIRATYQKYADMADTVISYTGDDVTKLKSAEYYDEGYAKLGSTITVTTTIAEPYRKDYYVKAFSVNGYSYGIIDSSKANADGVYSFEYTIPEDCTDKFIEITPIYYYIDDTNTVTFYVEGFDETVQAKWGNTVAVQAWYTKGTDTGEFNSDTMNALGGYPGQPLVYQGGKYSMQIPKYLNGDPANKVSGITLNNYIWDSVHSGNFTSQLNDNAQTYDYDDFYKLSETQDVDNIIFDFRYRTKTDNAPSQDGLSSSNYEENELEPLTDYYGNIVDIFGNFLSEDWTTDYDSKYLTVISDGYQKNYIGKYATEWSVYDREGKYITTINCSSLIDENKVDSTYQEAYDKLKQQCAGLPVKIAYEKSNFGGDDQGTRADGRWYFSKKEQKITANVQIQYRTDDNSPFVEDKFKADSNVGEKTDAQAYFTNADYSGKTTCKGTVDGGKFSVHAQTDANANYYFIGWYLKTSDGYSFITNESDADFPMTNNETYVARFIPTPSGTLTLSHTLLDGSADGKTFIKADIVDKTGAVKATIPEVSGNLVIPSKYVTYTSTYSIKATLRTVPYGNDTVEDFYNSSKEHYNSGVTGTGEKTHSVERAISSLFEGSKDADNNVSYKLIKSNIPFYSKITSQPLDYTITYTYKTRLNGEQSYVIKDKVSGIELQEMWDANEAAGLDNKYQLSKEFITKKAPFVSNFREEIRWNMDEAVIEDYTATVTANTRTVDLEISALPVAGINAGMWPLPATVKYGELAKSSNGDYLYKTGTTEFPEKFNYSGTTDYDFSFWAIFDNIDEAQKYSDAVKAYMLDAPAADMSQRLTELTKLDGYKNLIAKSYSKEYNYVSYQNYYIVPVYADRFAKEDIKESQASIRLLEYTRNQWTTGDGVKGDGKLNTDATKKDYLYTDFALSFDKDQLLIKNNPNIKVGVTFEVVAKYDDVKSLDSYETPSDKAAIGNLVKAATNNSKDNGKVGTYTINNESRSVYRYEIENSNISVKNRIEYYLRFKNSETSQQNVMKVYSYIYDTVSGKIYLSDPVYMNMYDIGNLTYITSDLANINLGSDATV